MCLFSSPLALVPAPLRDGGQFGDAAVAAVQALGGPPRHNPLQPPVVGLAAFRGGVVRQALGDSLAPQPQVAVCNLKPNGGVRFSLLAALSCLAYIRGFKNAYSHLLLKSVTVNRNLASF